MFAHAAPLLALLAAPLVSSLARADEPVRICQFSLNNTKELEATREFVRKVNAASPVRIEVKEFMTEKANPNEAFRKMVDSGVRCDGLVISGHHTGNYGGKRALKVQGKSKLELDFMESLACDPKNAAFFQNINAAWLEGCRTLGVGEIEAQDDQIDADFHTNRVGQVVDDDGLMQSFADLNMEYSNTLDQDNPLASRYLRLFPQAKLFGWTRSAPGEKARSYLSLLYHMAQTARRLDGDKAFPANAPDAPELSADSAARYANALLVTLSRFGAEQRGCEQIAVDGWLAHGNVGLPGKYYFDNPDLKALTSLASTGNKDMFKAHELDCMLKTAAKTRDPNDMGRALDLITANPDFLRYSFNTLVDLRSELLGEEDKLKKRAARKASDAEKQAAQMILEKMRKDPRILDFLKTKIASRHLGVTRKIDYYRFYASLTSTKDPQVEKDIQMRVVSELAKPLPALTTGEHPARSQQLAAEYRAGLLQALVKNKLASPAFYDELLKANPEPDVLQGMARQVVNYLPGNRIERLMRVVASPKSNEGVEKAAWQEIARMRLAPEVEERVREDFEEAKERGKPSKNILEKIFNF